MVGAGCETISSPPTTRTTANEGRVTNMETTTQAKLMERTLAIMEDELRIPKKNATDFVESLRAVIEEDMALGNKTSVFGIVTLTPTGVLAKPKRKGTDPRTGEERTFDAQPAKTRIKLGIAKRFKEALPGKGTKAHQALQAEAKKRADDAAARRAEREREEAKAAKAGTAKKSAPAKKKK